MLGQTACVSDGDEQARDQEVIRQALDAAVRGPFFPDPWFQTIFGVDRVDMAGVLRAWPTNDSSETTFLAVNNALAMFRMDPYGSGGSWADYTDATEAEATATVHRWKASWPLE